MKILKYSLHYLSLKKEIHPCQKLSMNPRLKLWSQYFQKIMTLTRSKRYRFAGPVTTRQNRRHLSFLSYKKRLLKFQNFLYHRSMMSQNISPKESQVKIHSLNLNFQRLKDLLNNMWSFNRAIIPNKLMIGLLDLMKMLVLLPR